MIRIAEICGSGSGIGSSSGRERKKYEVKW